jgi:hypothetical protein
MSLFGRYQVAEAPSSLLTAHFHDGVSPLHEVDWEPKVGVLDQSNLDKQGIDVSTFIPGAPKGVKALGSCTAQGTTSALSNLLVVEAFAAFVGVAPDDVYTDAKAAEIAAIKFYHACSSQTGDPGQEWPPTDCGSSGPYIVTELQLQKLCSDDVIAHGAQNIVSLMQQGGLLVGQPFLNAWMEPDSNGFIDGDGSDSTLQAQIQLGVAGGHETYLSAIERLCFLPSGLVDAYNTVIRFRNSWNKSWGDNGSYRAHLSTYVTLGQYCDFRLLVA